MALKDELQALRPLFGTESEEYYSRVENIAKKYTTDEDKKEINAFMTELLNDIGDEMDQVKQDCIKLQLQDVSEIISIAWIAKTYFGKTKNWLYQRINGNIVNGKACRFTDEEIDIFNRALQDISKKIGSLNISY
ncbi:DUF5053 domain-containing protein [Bacteroides fragilis]|nr:DUF5053 domain-containing protein [Bacteroides fragilis]